MTRFPIAFYDAFTATAFGGSQAAVITSAAALDHDQRLRIAREIGLPATAFVDDCDGDSIRAQFMSTVMELPMCGHGTLCLLTHMTENGCIETVGNAPREIRLHLPKASARVTVARRADDRLQVMLDIDPPRFEPAPADIGGLLARLGLDDAALARDLAPETARGNFVHLLLPLSGLAAMRAIRPDFGGIVDYCREQRIETVAAFCREVERPESMVHLRDFCPAVGVAESAAAGTTNAALTAYLLRHGIATAVAGRVEIRAEQGIELERPSSIQSVATLRGQGIERLQVGGIATRVMQGQFYLEV